MTTNEQLAATQLFVESLGIKDVFHDINLRENVELQVESEVYEPN